MYHLKFSVFTEKLILFEISYKNKQTINLELMMDGIDKTQFKTNTTLKLNFTQYIQ